MYFKLLICSFTVILWIVDCTNESVSPRKPVFTEYPRDAFPLLRQQLRLFCRADGESIVSITWYKDGKVVETQRHKPGTSNRITKAGELLFLSFSEEDEGHYYCNASNIHGWTSSPSALVKAAYFDTSSASSPESKSAYLGQTVLLECIPPTGSPAPTVYWKHNNQKIIDSSRTRLMENGGLRIDSAKRQDAGMYQCFAENSAGHWDSKPATLTVRRKPRFKFTPMSKQAIVGDSVEFQCLASEDPNSTILWRREGNKIIQASLIDRKTLRIEHVQLSDGGDYICEAKSVGGNVEAIAHLSVISPPIFVITPEDKTVPLGGQVSFDCLTSGSPPPSVRWLHNKFSYWIPKPSEKPLQTGRFQVFPNGTLFINSTVLSDAGLFECKASQKAGIVKSTAQLFFESLVMSLPLIEIGPQNRTIFQGMVATLPCHSTVLQYTLQVPNSLIHSNINTFTPIITQWLVNNSAVSTISNPRVVMLNSGSLQINALRMSDTGYYTCKVEIQDFSSTPFSRRSTSWTAFLQVTQGDSSGSGTYLSPGDEVAMLLPDPPKNVKVTSIGDTWVVLDLANDQTIGHVMQKRDLSETAFITGVQVEVTEFNTSSSWRVVESSGAYNSVRVNGLLPHTGYHILVRYVNHYGVGKPFILNKLVFTKTLELTRNFLPTELVVRLQSVDFSPLHVKAISPSELLAEWFLCGPPDSLFLITGFKATYRSVPMSRCITSNREGSGYYVKESIMHYPKADQNPCAFKGDSMENLLDSYEDDLTPCSLPLIPKQQSLDWSPPSFLNGEKVDYYVRPSEVTTATTSIKMAISNLRPFICYAIRIETFIDHPEHSRIFAQKSQVSVALTYDTTPTGAPQITNVRWLKNGTVLQLDWNPPNEWERGGILTGYSLKILTTGLKLSRTVNMGTEQSSFHIYDLDPWSNYTLYLSAVTCHGEGVRSLPVYIFAYPTQGHFLGLDVEQSKLPVMNLNQHESGIVFRKVLYDGRSLYPGSQSLSEHMIVKTTEAHEDRVSLTREPWFIVSAVMFSVLWVLICLGLIIYGRHRSERQRRRHTVLDVMDVEIIAKNGRLGGVVDSTQEASTPQIFMGNFSTSTETKATPLTLMEPLAVNSSMLPDRNHTPKQFGNSYVNGFITRSVNPSYSVSVANTFSLTNDGSLQSVPSYLPQYPMSNPMLSIDNLKNHSFNNSGVMVPNVSIGGSQLLPGGTHCPPELIHTTNATHLLPNGCLPIPTLGHNLQDQSSGDHATPYASVSVIQPMIFDHMPVDYAAAIQQGQSRGRQLSLAEIIPPPPDYPPPSLPSFSPVPHHFTSWSLGEAPCSGGSGEDSAAYSDFRQSSSQIQGGPPVPSSSSSSHRNWLMTSQHESVSGSTHPTSSHSLSKTSGLSSEWPNNESLSLTPHSTEQHIFAHRHPSASLSTIQPSHVAC
ncbi:Roundabout 2 isoform 2 [Schistosoma japonicum]|uniref:Roundabout 2 isoform 2 n=2 Tax=Schistosoma japonicum TaxID=6182 RepID=A0A4Z2DD51_SCHJA|nr:Protein sax-3 [Schistosoma japonicum]TNN14326.1 Roundabout 2 isoform 2 [Schistosoma japonicum]